ncbi:MAG: hypothetical protein CMN30_16820 [Sandaracinus sp.]|nr:hypothetical protein [Sandaracinus sp.]
MYRRSAKPAPTTATLELRPRTGRNVLIGLCLWSFLAIVLSLAVGAAVRVHYGMEDPLALLALVLVPLAPLLAWRLVRYETAWLGAETLRVAGVFRDGSIRWDAITRVERIRRRQRGGSYPVTILHGAEGRAVEVHPLWLNDPTGALRRALAILEEEDPDLRAIEAIVREEASPSHPWDLWVHAGIAVAIAGLAVAGLTPGYRRDAERRDLARAVALPSAEARPALEALFADTDVTQDVRCRAGANLAIRALNRGDYPAAAERCESLRGWCSSAMPHRAVRCEGPFTALPEASAALRAGRPVEALERLGRYGRTGLASEMLHADILDALGQPAEAREVAAHCAASRRAGRDATELALIDRCAERAAR